MSTPKRTITEEIQERRRDHHTDVCHEIDDAMNAMDDAEEACARSKEGHRAGGKFGDCVKCGAVL